MRFLLPVFIFLTGGINLVIAGVKPQVISAAPIEQLGFKENKNQWVSRILFNAELNGAEVFLERTGIYFVLLNRDDLEKVHPSPKPASIHGHAYEVTFEGASTDAQVMKAGESVNYYNYIIGKNPKFWASHVHSYSEVFYKNIYPGIDVKFYFDNNLVKYEFIVHPGADASVIKLKYDGADNLYLNEGSLHIKTSVGEAVEALPLCYQSDHLSQSTDVKSNYRLNGNTLSFDFPAGYDNTQELIIDPTLIFSTYTGSTADNWGFTCTYDKTGYMYLGGLVSVFYPIYNGDSTAFPVTPGAFQITNGGGDYSYGLDGLDSLLPGYDTIGVGYPADMSIAKINPTGTAYVYATYLGGRRNDTPNSLFVNSQGQLVILGRTYSPDFPVTANAYNPNYNGQADMAITVLSADGGSLVGSTFMGGSADDGVNSYSYEMTGGWLKKNYGDDSRGEVVCDANNNIYVASCTQSADFPVTAGCYQSQLKGAQNGCIFKLNPNVTSLIYSTFIGGDSVDACYSIALKASDGTVYATGGTMSNNFPTTAGVIHPNYLGGYSDGFIVHLSADGKTLLNSTYVGTNDTDQSYSVKLDGDENVYVVGLTSGQYPITAGVYSNPNSGQFITKLKPGLDSVYFSTVVGNGTTLPNISPVAFLIDTCGNIYVCGWGGNLFIDFVGYPWPFNPNNMFNMPLTADAYQKVTDGNDFYIIVLSKNAGTLLYATYFGGYGALEHVDGGTSRFDPNGVIYEAICESCINHVAGITTPGVISTTDNSPNCNEMGFKIDLGQVKVIASAVASPAASGCVPLKVTFENNSQNAINYNWDFIPSNPKDTSTMFQPVFTYTDTGTYIVRLIASNPADCIPIDTAYTKVVVYDSKASAFYSDSVTNYCDSIVVKFTASASGSNMQFTWNFGDGTLPSNEPSPSHTYTKPGIYTTSLILRNDTACNELDTVTHIIAFTTRVEALLGNDSIVGCAPVTADLKNIGFGVVTSYYWNFGDGTFSTDSVVSHTYTQPGVYNAFLVVYNPAACNRTDTAHILVHVYASNVNAAFVENPSLVTGLTPVQFTNQSTGNVYNYWSFGDDSSSTAVNPQHTYFHDGNYTVCLTVSNGGPCPSSTCRQESIYFNPNVGVPNAFTPNGDGENDVLYVKGQGIASIDFKVFNRWGQLVFETNNINIGWDGTYKGVPQEMDVYAWELVATLDTQEQVKKSGNVTLIR